MRSLLYSLVILALVSCETRPERVEVYSVLHDITDPLLAQPDADDFLEFMTVHDGQKSITLRYRVVSDVDFNPVTHIVRHSEQTGLFSNAIEEKRKGQNFTNQCNALLAKKMPIEGESHSSIFQPIVSELKYLSSLDKAHKKTLIVFSDLRENCEWLSFYRYRDLKLLLTKPEAIARLFLKQAEGLTSSDNISVHIIFIPEDHLDNVNFKRIQSVYQEVFNILKIPISFSANLTKAENTP